MSKQKYFCKGLHSKLTQRSFCDQKNCVSRRYVITDLNGEKIIETSSEKELLKANQSD